MKCMNSLLLVSLLSGLIVADDLPIVLGRNTTNEAVFKQGNSFFAELNGKQTRINDVFVDAPLRKLSPDQIKLLVANGGYLSLAKFSNSDNYKLELKGRLRGGGPVSGLIAYWTTKALCYGVAAGGAATAVVATGGAAGAITGGIVAGATAGLSTGATVVGGVVAGSGAIGTAATATGGVVAGAGGISAAITMVETASAGVGALFTAIPFLP